MSSPKYNFISISSNQLVWNCEIEVMLTESFLASTLSPEKPNNQTSTGIHLHDFQPIPALKSTFKKSSTNANCLAVHPTHLFAAQADKAIVNVYNRERNHQEAVVPFPEKIHSIAVAGESDGAGTLILGTEEGRLILWEVRSVFHLRIHVSIDVV